MSLLHYECQTFWLTNIRDREVNLLLLEHLSQENKFLSDLGPLDEIYVPKNYFDQ